MPDPESKENHATQAPFLGLPEWGGLAQFVSLYFSLQFLVAIASLLVGGLGMDPMATDPEGSLVSGGQNRILQGILGQIAAFFPGMVILRIWSGPSVFGLGNLGNPVRLLGEFVIVALGCHLMHQGALWINQHGFGFGPQPHPFTKLGGQNQAIGVWLALILAACFVAPVNEEIIFRKLTKMWLGGPTGIRFLLCLAAGAAFLGASHNPSSGIFERALPIAWVTLLYGLITLGKWSPETKWTIASAALFSAIHSFAWPTPIPLFIFGLYQSRLMGRTGGLLAPILFHSWFNLIGVVGLWWEISPN